MAFAYKSFLPVSLSFVCGKESNQRKEQKIQWPMRAEFSGFSFSRMFLGRCLYFQSSLLIVDQALTVAGHLLRWCSV